MKKEGKQRIKTRKRLRDFKKKFLKIFKKIVAKVTHTSIRIRFSRKKNHRSFVSSTQITKAGIADFGNDVFACDWLTPKFPAVY